MELSLNIGLSEKKSNTAALFKTKSAKVILFVLLTVLFAVWHMRVQMMGHWEIFGHT